MNWRILKYASVYLSIGIIFASLLAGGYWIFIAPLYVFGIIPLLELIIPGTTENMSKAEEEMAKKDIRYDLLVWSVVPVQFGLMIFCLFKVSHSAMPWWELGGHILAFGISCGVLGINVGHELGHRFTKHEQIMAKMLLSSSLYMHFFIEHNRGHHRHVSTDEDPASARYGETLYAFWFRSVVTGWLSAWKLESERLNKAGISFWSIQNEMLRYQFIQGGMLLAIFFIFGLKALLFFIASAMGGALMLETVNYIEHYGLRRKKVDDAYYEKVLPIHSWNSNHPVGRIMLFELTRHSDHHYLASRKYQILRHFDHSPQMPTGYPGMMVLSLFPPLWFKVMHRAIDEYKNTGAGMALA